MEGTEEVDKLMEPVLQAIKRHVSNEDGITDIYNRAYEAVLEGMGSAEKRDCQTGGQDARTRKGGEMLADDRCDAALKYIKEYTKAHGYAPSIAEIGQAIGVRSKSLISYYLTRLENSGEIARDYGIARSIRVM